MSRKKLALQIPAGVRDLLPAETWRLRQLEQRLLQIMAAWGYAEVITPAIEFYDALTLGDGGDLGEQMYKFFDREGHILALRPDLTTPIARLVATRLQNNDLPLRLGYAANVFRYENIQTGRQREFRQAGVELIGSRSSQADAEVIALAVESLAAAGLTRFQISVGQIEIFKGIMDELQLDKETQREVKRTIAGRDLVGLEEVVDRAGINAEGCELILSMTAWHGGPEILAEAAAAVGNPRSLAAIKNLQEIFTALAEYGVADRVAVDFGILRGFEYYTGMVFEGYTPGIGYPVCGGGRYDHLLGKFGFDVPATGFALGLERVLLAIGEQGTPAELAPEYLVTGSQPAAVINRARELRAQGLRVEVEIMGRTAAEAAAYALKKGIKKVINTDEL